MKRVVSIATALVFTALAFGPAGAQSGSPGGPPQVADDEQMQQMMKRMQDMQDQMRDMRSQMQGMGSMHGDMRQMKAMMAQMQGMMQQHREQMGMGMQCPMMAAPQPPAKSEP
jgi:hypothetical protein